VQEALTVLKEIRVHGKRIAVLGDMLELGSYSYGSHSNIGKIIPGSSDILITVGIRAKEFAHSAHKAKMYKRHIFECENAVEAGERLKAVLGEGDIVLIKGSQSMRMEKTVLAVMAEPEKKKELLVRQEKAWLDR